MRALRLHLLRRYAALQERWGSGFVLLVQQDYAEVRELAVGAEVRERTRSLVEALAPEEAGPADRLRVRLALTTFQVAAATAVGGETTDRVEALALALDVLRGESR